MFQRTKIFSCGQFSLLARCIEPLPKGIAFEFTCYEVGISFRTYRKSWAGRFSGSAAYFTREAVTSQSQANRLGLIARKTYQVSLQLLGRVMLRYYWRSQA